MTTLLSAACSSSTPTASVTSPSATPSAELTVASSPAPAALCSATSRCLALVTLRGSTEVIVRDITDITHPKTVSAQGWFGKPQFVKVDEVSFIEAGLIFRSPIVVPSRTAVAGGLLQRGLISAYGWSPDASASAYVTYNDQMNTEVHLVSGGTDRLLLTEPGLPFVRPELCTTQACIDGENPQVVYSPDGGLILWSRTPGSKIHIWRADGVEVTPSSLASASMPVWSGGSLYFQDAKGIEVFHAGAVSPFLPSVSWIRPKASPAGGRIVYESRDATGLAHSYIVNTVTATVTELGAGRAEPAFLTSRYLWYQGERLCDGAERCDLGLVKPTGKTYIYDLQDGTEATSIITSVADVWLHAA